MPLSAFNYMGGKSFLSSWIVGTLPEHELYVEPFGGSAGVLLNKPRSHTEVYNDLNGNAVHFFETLRESEQDLVEEVERIVYSEELREEWAQQFAEGSAPSDDVERAARWLFLRYSTFNGECSPSSTFKRDSPHNNRPPSKVWQNVPERLREVRERFRGVCLLNEDYRGAVERYTGKEGVPTVVYYDPPYLEAEPAYYATDGFDHSAFAEHLQEIDCYAVVSYSAVPEAVRDLGWYVAEKDYRRTGRVGKSAEWEDTSTERLLLNYDPREEATASGKSQETLENYAEGPGDD